MSDRDHPGQLLASYRGVAEGVELWCAGCCTTRVFPLEAVIERLGNVGVREVAGLTTKPCPQCGGTRFESRPAFSYRPNDWLGGK